MLTCMATSLYAQTETYQYHIDKKTNTIEFMEEGRKVVFTFEIDSSKLITPKFTAVNNKVYINHDVKGTFHKKLFVIEGNEYKFRNLFFSDRRNNIIKTNTHEKIFEFTLREHENFEDTLIIEQLGSTGSLAADQAIKIWGLMEESKWLLKDDNVVKSIKGGVATSLGVFAGLLIYESLDTD